MSNNIESKIQNVKDKYYQEHTKNTIFKKKQKIECANKVIDEVGLNNLIEQTIYYQEGTNVILLNYPIFKTFVTSDICDRLVQYLIDLLEYGKTYYNKVEVHINLDGLTITAIERYKQIIEYSMHHITDTYDNIIETCILINAPTFTNQLISLCSSLLGPSRFSNLQTKLIVISKK